MDLLNFANLITQPNGFWEKIIFGLESAVKDYALALILITVIIKLVMVPFDFINRYVSKKSSRKQQEMKPDLEKVNQKYANDKNLLNQKTMEVYKKHNFSIMGTCLGTLLYLVFTSIVFITLLNGLNSISNYKISDQYLQVRKEYFATYEIDVDELEEETALEMLEDKIALLTIEEQISTKTQAEENAIEKYNQAKQSFLWIENIWLSDTTTNPIMTYKDFTSRNKTLKAHITETEYNLIMQPIKENSTKNNGYFILVVLAAGLNFLSMSVNNWISKYRAKKKGIDDKLTNPSANKIMVILMPALMGLFTLFSNSAFGLYIVAGALITFITSPLVTLFVDMLEFEAINKRKDKVMATYDRKRK